VLPILLQVDRIGQIEQLTTLQRKLIGKRPHGILMPQDVWDAKIIDSFKNCGFDYVLLDSELLPEKEKYLPVIIENTGKTVYALPVYKNLVPNGLSARDYLTKITRTCAHSSQNALCTILLNPDQALALLDNSWFDDFLELCAASPDVSLIIPSQFLKEPLPCVQAFVPPVMKNNTNIYEYIQKHLPSHLLYSRMMHVSMLVNQCRGDRNKKQLAKEKLWQAQTGLAFHVENADKTRLIEQEDKLKNIIRLRRSAYRNLIQAEKISREMSGFLNSLVCFDVNADGSNEYICQFDTYNAFITKKGGSVYELDILRIGVNYADTFTLSEFTTKSDSGTNIALKKNIFTDHFLKPGVNARSMPAYSRDIWTAVNYAETLFDSKRKEIRLLANVLYGEHRQKITLKKNYLATEHGLQVQYIVKNESTMPVNAVFAVESSLSIPVCTETDMRIELITENNTIAVPILQRYEKTKGVALAVITDVQNNISFVFETNEESGFICSPNFENPSAADFSYATTVLFFWNIDLMPNMETEKILNLNIITPRFKKQKK
jgi:hypothetical protein